MFDTDMIFADMETFELSVPIGVGTINILEEATKARGMQFREVRLSCIAPWDIQDIRVLITDFGEHMKVIDEEVITMPFDALREMNLNDGPAVLVLSDVESAAPSVLKHYSNLASPMIKIIKVLHQAPPVRNHFFDIPFWSNMFKLSKGSIQ